MAYLCLAKLSPLDPATGNRVDIYIASSNDRRITGLNGQVWEPAMTTQPVLSFQGFNGDFIAPIEAGDARLAFNMAVVRNTWPSIDTYAWAGAPVTIYAEEPGTAWPWTARFVGKVANFGRKRQVITLGAKVDLEPFQKDVLTQVYGGGGGAEGGSDIKNRVKPLVIGWAMNVEPVLVDATNSVYQFSAYGAIEAVTTLYERGSDFGASVGDYANYTDLVAATIPPGRWGTCLATGMVRLGAPAYGVITGDIKGHKVGSTTPRLTGAIINALATISGVSSGSIETSTLTTLDSDVPYNINLALFDQITFLDIARRLALPCNYQAGVSLGGKLFVTKPSFSISETLTLDTRGRALPLVTDSDMAEVSPPYYRTVMGANRAWRVHSADEIAYAVTPNPRGDYSGSTTYREGDIVTSPDGSTWIYIATTAGSGNAPPTWPTTSNAYWDNMTGPSEVAYSAYLTNESATVSANSSGTVSSFTPASGSMILLEAGDPVASGVTYSVASSSNLTISINSSTGSYTVSAMSADTGTATLRATYSGKTFDKVYTLSKVKEGAAGSTGATGAAGTNGLNNAVVTLYKRGATSPSVPFGTFTYTFATGALTGGTINGWTSDIPATDGNPLWSITALASSNTSTASIAAASFTAPAKVMQDGATGTAGTSALSIVVTKKSVSLPAYANGDVTDFSPATGQLTVYLGNTDVTASATLSATASGCTGTINTATNTPVSSQPKGYYRVTAMSADTATLTLTATYSGQTLTEVFALSKAKGGYEIVGALPSTNLFEGRVVYLTTDDKLYRYTGSAWTAAVPAVDLTGTITTTQITDGAISTPKLAANAVTANELAADAVTSNKIQAGAVTAAKLATTELITLSAQIGDGVITNAKIGNLEVDSAKIANLTVGTNKITDNAITQSVSAFTATMTPVVGVSYDTIQSCTITAEAGDVVDIVATMNAQFISGSNTVLNFRFVRGSTVIYQAYSWTPQYICPAFVDIPGAGTHTYELQVANAGLSCEIDVSNRYMRLLRVRK